MTILVSLLLLLGPAGAESETLRVSMVVAPEAVNAVPGVPGLQ
jgi:hypothetical protein